jgi:hypothetical protein
VLRETTESLELAVRRQTNPHSRDLFRIFQLVLATIWLVDGFLQLQPVMFQGGSNGFSSMLRSMATGNPGLVAQSIRWDAAFISHHPVITNALFAVIQIAIALGIVWRRTIRGALALSIVWCLLVWWFGEGLGGILSGGATPLTGGPGAVLFYALLALLLWPRTQREPLGASDFFNTTAAKSVWTISWIVLSVLCVVGNGRSSSSLATATKSLQAGQPGWLGHITAWSVTLLGHHGEVVAVCVAIFFLLLGFAIYLPAPIFRLFLVTGIVLSLIIWVAVEQFGGVLAGGATDPNSGPLLVLLLVCYWPLRDGQLFKSRGNEGVVEVVYGND